MEQLPQLHRVAHLRQHRRDIGAVRGAEHDAQNEHCQNGADGAHGHQTKAVVRRVAVAADRRHTHTQCHDEGHRHGAGGHAAGIKGHSKELPGHKDRQKKDDAVKQYQQPGQRDADEHSQEGKHQKQAHARRHRQDKGRVGDRGHLICQHLQVRLRDGDEKAQQEADAQNHRQLPAFGDHRAHALAHGGHAHFRAQGEEHDAQHDHGCAQQKAQQDAG